MAAKLQKKDHKNYTFLWSIAFVVVKTNPTYIIQPYLLIIAYTILTHSVIYAYTFLTDHGYLCLYTFPDRSRVCFCVAIISPQSDVKPSLPSSQSSEGRW